MTCLVTAGATWEPVDQVRRLTNFSTGSLGTALAVHLANLGHPVELLLAESAPTPDPVAGLRVERFSTSASLAALFEVRRPSPPQAVFHAAAVGDFQCAGAYERAADGTLTPLRAGKLSTRDASVWLELRPAPKLLATLRGMYPAARLVGWKFETDGNRDDVLARVARQFAESRTDACVANGPAYGDGFGLVRPDGSRLHLPDRPALLQALGRFLEEAIHPAPVPLPGSSSPSSSGGAAL